MFMCRRHVSMGLLLFAAAGCSQDEALQLASGIYRFETINVLSNGCGYPDGPFESLSVSNDYGAPQRLSFSDITVAGVSAPAASATVTDGEFHLVLSVPVSGTEEYINDMTGQTEKCLLTITFDFTSSILDSQSWSIDEGIHRIEPNGGPADICGYWVRTELGIPAYDDAAGCEQRFSATLK